MILSRLGKLSVCLERNNLQSQSSLKFTLLSWADFYIRSHPPIFRIRAVKARLRFVKGGRGSPAVLAGAVANVIDAARFGMPGPARRLAVLLATLSIRQDETPRQRSQGSILNTQLRVPAVQCCSIKYLANGPRLSRAWCWPWLNSYRQARWSQKVSLKAASAGVLIFVSSSLTQS